MEHFWLRNIPNHRGYSLICNQLFAWNIGAHHPRDEGPSDSLEANRQWSNEIYFPRHLNLERLSVKYARESSHRSQYPNQCSNSLLLSLEKKCPALRETDGRNLYIPYMRFRIINGAEAKVDCQEPRMRMQQYLLFNLNSIITLPREITDDSMDFMNRTGFWIWREANSLLSSIAAVIAAILHYHKMQHYPSHQSSSIHPLLRCIHFSMRLILTRHC